LGEPSKFFFSPCSRLPPRPLQTNETFLPFPPPNFFHARSSCDSPCVSKSLRLPSVAGPFFFFSQGRIPRFSSLISATLFSTLLGVVASPGSPFFPVPVRRLTRSSLYRRFPPFFFPLEKTEYVLVFLFRDKTPVAPSPPQVSWFFPSPLPHADVLTFSPISQSSILEFFRMIDSPPFLPQKCRKNCSMGQFSTIDSFFTYHCGRFFFSPVAGQLSATPKGC